MLLAAPQNPTLPTEAPEGFEEMQTILIAEAPEDLRWLEGRSYPLFRSVSCHGLSIYIMPPTDSAWPATFREASIVEGIAPRVFIESWERHVEAAPASSGVDWIYRDR